LLLNTVDGAKRGKAGNRDVNDDGYDDETGAWIPRESKFDTPETREFVNNATKITLAIILFCSISQCLRNSF